MDGLFGSHYVARAKSCSYSPEKLPRGPLRTKKTPVLVQVKFPPEPKERGFRLFRRIQPKLVPGGTEFAKNLIIRRSILWWIFYSAIS